MQVAKTDFLAGNARSFQGDEAAPRNLGALSSMCFLAIEPHLDLGAQYDNFELIPRICLNSWSWIDIHCLGYILKPQKNPIPRRKKDFWLFRQLVQALFSADQDGATTLFARMNIQCKMEIAGHKVADQKGGFFSFRWRSNDLAVFHFPLSAGGAPAGQILAVEETGDIIGCRQHRRLAAAAKVGHQRTHFVLRERLQ